MLNKAVRMHGKNDLRLDTYALPDIADGEILMRVVSDSICMSSYKAVIQGTAHKRVPEDIAEHPPVFGHEFCGVVEKVGARWRGKYEVGEKVAVQTNIIYKGTMLSPGFAFEFCGGETQYAVMPPEIMEQDCLLRYRGEAFFCGSLAEPLSCIIGAFHAQYHTRPHVYVHDMGIREGGCMAILGGAGPMGLGTIDYALHGDRRPALLAVTDINQARLDRAGIVHSVEEAARQGVRLVYLNPGNDAVDVLRALTGGKGFDDVFVFTPKTEVVEQADALLGEDGCLNFFAGPTDHALAARMNFYDVHYGAHHVVGTSGGSTEDMVEALELTAANRLRPEGMITHVGGLDAAPEATLRLPELPGGKKLIYTHKRLPLTAIADFAAAGQGNPLFARLDAICRAHDGLWCPEAEKYLLEHAEDI